MTKDAVQRHAEGAQDVAILVALHEGRVMIGFQLKIEHIMLAPEAALELAEGVLDVVPQTDPEIATGPMVLSTTQGPKQLVTAPYKLGTTADGQVLIDLWPATNFLKFTDGEAMFFAQALIDMAKLARQGAHVATGSALNPSRR